MHQTVAAPQPMITTRTSQNLVNNLVLVLVLILAIPVLFRIPPDDFQPFLRLTTWRFLGMGVLATVGAALVSILISLPLAVGLGLMRLERSLWLKVPGVVIIEGIRSLPVILLIFYIFLRLELLHLPATPGLAVILALTLYTAAVNAEILRAGILSLEKGQMEAAQALGLSYWQRMWLVILPQAFRRTLPTLIAQFTTLLKDTSLGAIIGFLELQRRGTILFQQDKNVMATLYIVAIIYFILNYVLGRASEWVEAQQSRSPARAVGA
ncbi:MAG: amino acid ABC transporter permease [Chloroflexi bacterium]|nr:amino acid ABC transporter permease [Chloroflexota bacterium]